MPALPEPLERLIQELSRLPGIGPKTAQRLAFHLLRVDGVRAQSLAQAIQEVKARIGYCERCYNIAEGPVCAICESPRRDASVICVVESAFDVLAIERTAEFSGLYFVLHGVISPIDGIGPEQIHVQQLLDRARDEGVADVNVATDAVIEVKATAAVLQPRPAPLLAKDTPPAHGLPVGAHPLSALAPTLPRASA